MKNTIEEHYKVISEWISTHIKTFLSMFCGIILIAIFVPVHALILEFLTVLGALPRDIQIITLILLNWIYKLTWRDLGVVAEIFVSVSAVAGYFISYNIYKKQEINKYKPTIVLNFIDLPFKSTEEFPVESSLTRIPGLTIWGDSIFISLIFESIGLSTVLDLNINFYIKEPKENLYKLFKKDFHISDGLSYGSTGIEIKRRIALPEFGNQDLYSKLSGEEIGGYKFKPKQLRRFIAVTYNDVNKIRYFSLYEITYLNSVIPIKDARIQFQGVFIGDNIKKTINKLSNS